MEDARTSRYCRLNGNSLKMIAIVTMLIDHVGAAIIEPGILQIPGLSDTALRMWWSIDAILRMIGRISFPIFCYLIVEGFLHTKNVKKYALRLLAFCFISEIPFDLALFGTWFYPGYQNVYFTLLLGLLALMGLSSFRSSLWKQGLVIICTCGAAIFLRTDYSAFGVFLIILIYLLRENKRLQTILGCVSLCWEITAPLAFIPIRMYNGSRGKWNLKYIFYAFYPVHILVLWVIRVLLIG